MKNIVSILVILNFTILCSSQTKFYKEANGNILNSSEFKQLKKKSLENFKKTSSDITLLDKTKELRRNKDSIIFDIKLIGMPKSLAKEFESRKKLIGKKFIFENLVATNGKKINSEDFIGKPLVINFWFTQCAPCIEEIPILNNIKMEFKEDINFVSITFDSKEKVVKLLEKIKYDFIHLIDSKEIIKKLKIESYPQIYLIDKKGFINFIQNGIEYTTSNEGIRKIGDGKFLKEKLKKLLIE